MHAEDLLMLSRSGTERLFRVIADKAYAVPAHGNPMHAGQPTLTSLP